MRDHVTYLLAHAAARALSFIEFRGQKIARLQGHSTLAQRAEHVTLATGTSPFIGRVGFSGFAATVHQQGLFIAKPFGLKGETQILVKRQVCHLDLGFIFICKGFEYTGRTDVRTFQTEGAALDLGLNIGRVRQGSILLGVQCNGPHITGILALIAANASCQKGSLLHSAGRANQR